MRLSWLRPLYRDFGRWVSVYLDTSRRTLTAPEELRLRWREARNKLAAAGADAASIAAVEQALDDPALAAPGRALFARHGQLVLAPALRIPPEQPRAVIGSLPEVIPLLAQYLPPVPRVQVSAGRDGGEVLAVDARAASVLRGQPAPPEQAERAGGIEPVHKAHLGGQSRPRRESGIERNWDDNARDLAARVRQVASRVGASFVLVTGDVRARGLLRTHLGSPLADKVIVVDADVAVDSPELAAAAEAAVAARVAREDEERFEAWQRLNAHGLSAEGVPAVLAALRNGLAADVFLPRQPGDDMQVWTGPAPTDIATSESELRALGVAEPVRASVGDAVARAAAGTDAELRFLPEITDQRLPADQACAILR